MEYQIESERLQRQPYVAIRTTVRIDGIGGVMGPLFAELFAWLGQHGLAPAGAPWVRYLVVGPEECEFELAAPIAAESAGDGRIVAGTVPACDVLKTLHIGPYDAMVPAYKALTDRMAAQGALSAGAMWEVYLTDPTREPDPAKWQTLVYMPVSAA